MFEVPEEAAALKWPYAEAQSLVEAANAERKSREAISRQWISEGVPFAFKDYPALYEYIREWLGRKLQVPAKSISVTGSASLGQSIASTKFGQNFSKESDLDFFVVSETLFQAIVDDFNKWSTDYRNGTIHPNPKNPKEKDYWDKNLNEALRNIDRGFMDTWRVPNRIQYPSVQMVNNEVSKLTNWCNSNQDPKVPKFRKASIRCYQDWDKAIAQLSLNLKLICDSVEL